jgi:hypothetical protein
MSIFCTKCGSENSNENNFCIKCGLPLNTYEREYSDNIPKKPTKLGTKKKVVIGIGIFFGIIMILSAIGSSHDPITADENRDETQLVPLGSKNNPAHFLDTVVVNNIAYKVTNYRETHDLGDKFFGESADGIFIVIDMELENQGTKSTQITSNNFKLIDSKGREFETDNSAWIYLDNNVLLKQLQPSLSTKCQIVFDVPNPILEEKYLLEISKIFGNEKKYVLIQ